MEDVVIMMEMFILSWINVFSPPSNSVLIYWNFHHYNFAIRDCWQILQNKSFENCSALYFGMINHFFADFCDSCFGTLHLFWDISVAPLTSDTPGSIPSEQ